MTAIYFSLQNLRGGILVPVHTAPTVGYEYGAYVFFNTHSKKFLLFPLHYRP